MDSGIVIIGHGDIARTMAFFPGVVGYVHVERLTEILDPMSGELIGEVDRNKHKGVIGIGKPPYKEARAKEWTDLGFELTTLAHPQAYIDPRVKLGEGTSIWPFAFIDGETTIGRCSMVGVHTVIHYSTIGDYCHLTMHNKILPRSDVRGKSFVGVGATILENVVIGEGSAVGAESIVLKNIPPRHLYIGSRDPKLTKLDDGMYYPLTTAEKNESHHNL